MLDISMHLTNRVMKLETKNCVDNNGKTYIVATIGGEADWEKFNSSKVTLFISPEQAEQVAKALLSQVQQIQEGELING